MTSSSWYRRSLWNYKGTREYTRGGYEAAAARFVNEDLDVDCSERHYMITGANSGIGLQTAMEVARRGGIIHMVCRNQEAAGAARSEIITTTGNDKIHLHVLDLVKPREVILWAQRFAAQHERLHVLVHNAGCMLHERQLDEDGVEANFAVNTLAVHILTLTLMPLLERSEDSRVVMVSSAGLLCVRLDPHDLMQEHLEPFDGRLAYSQNKRQQVVMTLWYAQRYSKVQFASMHPGWADTPAVRSSLPQFYETMKDNLRTAAQGADTVVWLAVSKAALKHPSGLFFQDREPVSTHLPLAWTKSSIEDEDTLVNNIQNTYTIIYNRMFPKATDPQDTAAAAAPPDTTPSPNTSQTPAHSPQPEPEKAAPQASTEGESAKDMGHKHPLATETEEPIYPVLPPPPPPAEKGPSTKSEGQEVMEIHAPQISPQNEAVTPEASQENTHNLSTPAEEKTSSSVDKGADSRSPLPNQGEERKDLEDDAKADDSPMPSTQPVMPEP